MYIRMPPLTPHAPPSRSAPGPRGEVPDRQPHDDEQLPGHGAERAPRTSPGRVSAEHSLEWLGVDINGLRRSFREFQVWFNSSELSSCIRQSKMPK